MTQIDAPIFISGHTRSGTNLLLRLIDGADELVAPPGEGKLNILRRFNQLSSFENVWENIELNIDAPKIEQAFAETVLSKSSSSFNGGVFSLVHSLYDLFAAFKYPESSSQRRWIEKNHNLEFYFARAKLLFGEIKMVYVLRNPFDNWLSWKKYAMNRNLHNRKNALDLSATRMYINLLTHVINEIKEQEIGLNQYSDISQMLIHYGLKADAKGQLLDFLFSADSMSASENLGELFSVRNDPKSLEPEHCFALNYIFMFNKASYLADQYPQQFKIVRYEDLVCHTEQTMIEVANFCQYTHADINLRPTDGENQWGGNSSHNGSSIPGAKVSNASIGLWKDSLDADEVNNIRHVLEQKKVAQQILRD